MKRNTKQRQAVTIPGGALLGAVYALIWTLITSGVLGWLVHSEKMAEQSIGYGSMVIILSATMLGAAMSYGKVKRQRAIVCLSAGGIYFMMLLGITTLFFGGRYTGMGVTALLVLGGSAAAIFLCMERNTGKRRKIRI